MADVKFVVFCFIPEKRIGFSNKNSTPGIDSIIVKKEINKNNLNLIFIKNSKNMKKKKKT